MQGHIVLKPSDNVGITISGTLGSTLPVPDADVVGAIISIETADVRMRFDGTTPIESGADGSKLMRSGTEWEISGRDLLVAMVFVAVSSDAYVSAAYLKGE